MTARWDCEFYGKPKHTPNMKLKELNISLNPSYAENPGKYKAEVQYEDKSGKVTMCLDAKVSEALLLCIAETVTKFAADAAREVEKSILQSINEAQKPMLEANTADV